MSLKTLYRKRTVIWPFYFYTIIRTLSNIKFVTPSDFIIKTVDIETYKEETEDEDLLASNIIYDKEEVTIYSKEVSFIKNNSINKIATLDFNSLNRLLETDITNTFNEKHFSNLTDEGDDLFE
ncbi:hypothetical protein ABXM67_00010 [Enterococcus faecium]|uniref:hypothetical protein n=1 Tax=Enterococcus faecium TaxID=1352 RepID=UPI00346A4155